MNLYLCMSLSSCSCHDVFLHQVPLFIQKCSSSAYYVPGAGMQQWTRSSKISTLVEYTKSKQVCKGCVPQMVLSIKGKNRVKRGRGHGKIRSSPCSFNWGFTRAALRRWHMGKEPQEARRWTRWPCGEHARRKEERQMGRTVPWESENHIGALGRERRRDEGKASGR